MDRICERCDEPVAQDDDEFDRYGKCSPCLETERWSYQESMVF